MMVFNISEEVRDQIYAQALAEAPSECCGYIVEVDGKQTYVAMENLQDKYNKLDPEQYPRTSYEAFMMNTRKLMTAVEEAVAQGGKLFSIVHSHIDVGAYFSAEDKVQMANPDNSDQIYPADSYYVVAVKEGKRDGEAIFYYDQQKKDFIEGKLN